MSVIKIKRNGEWIPLAGTIDPSKVIIDKTLKLENHAADAKITGEKIEELELSVFNIDYNTLLAFDTTEIVIDMSASTSMLGKAILGQMILR